MLRAAEEALLQERLEDLDEDDDRPQEPAMASEPPPAESCSTVSDETAEALRLLRLAPGGDRTAIRWRLQVCCFMPTCMSTSRLPSACTILRQLSCMLLAIHPDFDSMETLKTVQMHL